MKKMRDTTKKLYLLKTKAQANKTRTLITSKTINLPEILETQKANEMKTHDHQQESCFSTSNGKNEKRGKNLKRRKK